MSRDLDPSESIQQKKRLEEKRRQALPAQTLLTQRNLAEQMKITEREIEERKSLIGFSDSDAKALRECKEYIIKNIDRIITEFYDDQQTIRAVELIIGDAETFNRLHASMKNYVIELFDGYYDLAYVEKRLRIGKVHKRIGVSPKLYISALVRLEALLHREVLVAVKQENNCTQCDQKRDSLHKLLMFDVQLVFDTYINSMIAEISSARDEIEIYAESLEATVAERTAQLQELSSRDALTGLLNQRSFYNILRREISRAEKNRGPLSLVYFDLNKFKSLNDTQGHKAGDELLALVGKNTRDSVRDFDISFRYGGDEFVIIMPDTLLGAAVTVCNQMASNFDKLKNQGVTFSIGVHQMGPDRYTDMDTFVKAADAYMYQAKAESKKFPGHYVRYEGFVKEEGN